MDNDGDNDMGINESIKKMTDTTEIRQNGDPVINIHTTSPTTDSALVMNPVTYDPLPGSTATTTTTTATSTTVTTSLTIPIHSTYAEPKRRVSIASDPVGESRIGYDNFGFEQNPRRKISQASVHSHTEVGPVRRKSILIGYGHDGESVNSHTSQYSNEPRQNGKPSQSLTALESVYSNIPRIANQNNNIEQSWIYSLCMRCRVEYNTPSWEPPHWQKVCPYPLCPSFRQFARIVSLLLIGLLIWITAFVIIGDSAAPGGQLFDLVVLTVASNFGGWLISLTTLPRLIGMLLVGILFQNVGWVNLDGDFSHITVELRKFALTIILIRAGLEMEPEAFKKVYKTILKLGIVPWATECVVVAVMSHFLLDLPWIWSFLLGATIAAVSPAVVVPCLFRLRTKGYGVAKGIPTLIIAVAGIDDALSVAIFGIISSIMFSESSLSYQISQAPVCIIGGLVFGIIWGVLSRYIPEKGDSYVVPIRTLMLFGGGLLAIFGSERIGYEGAGPLGVVFAAFISNYFWCKEGWDIEDNPVSTAFEIFWMIFEPILFGITGTTVKINELDSDIVSVGSGCLIAGVILRILCTVAIAFGDSLNLKEKFFVALSWMSKATVQAALGPVALKHLTPDTEDYEKKKHYAVIVQTIAVLSIILTAPLGAVLISVSGTKLLTKTKQPQVVEGWRRSHRPSLRDISIIDEEEEREDPEVPEDKTTVQNTNSNMSSINPSYTYTK